MSHMIIGYFRLPCCVEMYITILSRLFSIASMKITKLASRILKKTSGNVELIIYQRCCETIEQKLKLKNSTNYMGTRCLNTPKQP